MTRSIEKYTTLPSHSTVKCREVPLPLTTLIYIPNRPCVQDVCPPFWDNASCIPAAAAGHLATLPCMTSYEGQSFSPLCKLYCNILYCTVMYCTVLATLPCMTSYEGQSFSPLCKLVLHDLWLPTNVKAKIQCYSILWISSNAKSI